MSDRESILRHPSPNGLGANGGQIHVEVPPW
jgi:hypothetical protein